MTTVPSERRPPPATVDSLSAPPHNVELEQAVLGEVFLAASIEDVGEIEEAMAMLSGDAFYHLLHQRIWNAVVGVRRTGQVPDSVSVAEALRRAGHLEQCGGCVYVASLANVGITPAHLVQHAKELRALWIRRQVAAAAHRLNHAASNGSGDQEITAQIEALRALNSPTEPSSNRAVTAPDLLAIPEIRQWWPWWSQHGLVGPGIATLLSGHSKVAGKSTTIAHGIHQLLKEQPDLGVLVLSEEPPSVWRARLARWVDLPTLRFRFADGTPWPQMLREIERDPADVFVVDTVRSFAGIADENDASVVTAAVLPLVLLVRRKPKAVIALHHLRKTDAGDGLGHAGSTALVALFDVALELRRDPQVPTRRVLRSVSRFEETPRSLALELRDDRIVALGSPDTVALEEVAERVIEVLPDADAQGITRQEVQAALDEPRPSLEQIRRALRLLDAQDKVAHRGKGVRKDPARWYLR